MAKDKDKETCRFLIEVSEDNMVITTQATGKVVFDCPAEYIRPILGIVASLLDDEIPGMLDKNHIDRAKGWNITISADLISDNIFSGDW